MTYYPEQVTRGRLNAYCSSHATSDDRKSDSKGQEVVNNYDVCTARRLERYEERNVGDTEPALDTHNTNTDDRTITTGKIRELINKLECITSDQKQKLAAVLMKHHGKFTKKPGKCRGFEYTFQVRGQLPKSTNSRPLPFALRPAVSEKIRQLMKDDILEESHSSYLNPLTVVQTEGGSVSMHENETKICYLIERRLRQCRRHYKDFVELDT